MTEIQWVLERLRWLVARANELDLCDAWFEDGCSANELRDLEQRLRSDLKFRMGDWRARVDLPGEYLELLAGCRHAAIGTEGGLVLFSPMTVAVKSVSPECPRAVEVDLGEGLTKVQVVPIGYDGGENTFLMGLTSVASGAVWKWAAACPPDAEGVAKDGVVLLSQSVAGFLMAIVEELTLWCESRAGGRENTARRSLHPGT